MTKENPLSPLILPGFAIEHICYPDFKSSFFFFHLEAGVLTGTYFRVRDHWAAAGLVKRLTLVATVLSQIYNL